MKKCGYGCWRDRWAWCCWRVPAGGPGLSRARAGHGRRQQPGRAARRDRHAAQRRHRRAVDAGHRRRGPLHLRLRRARHLHDRGRAARLQDGRAAERPRAAARRRDGRPGARVGGDRGDGHGRRRAVVGAVQHEQLRADARAAADRPGADRRPQSLQPGVARPDDHGVAGDQREPAVPPRLRQRLRRRRRHPPRQRRAARRRAARRQLQDLLHAVDGRGRGSDGVEEQRRRRERQQPGRHHQPEHEVGHQPAARLGLRLRPRSEHELDQPTRRLVAPGQDTTAAARHRAARCTAAPSAARSSANKIFCFTLVRAVGRQAAALDRPHRADRARARAATSASRC